jgi:hypothetical protein
VEAIRGTYQFLSNKFQVDSGTLVFDSVEPLNPTVSASAHADLTSTNPPTRVTITLSDRIQTPLITMTDDQGRSQSDIATMLALGYNPKEQQANSKDAGVTATALGSQYLLRQFSQQFPEITPILGDVTYGTQIVETGDGGRKQVVPTIGIRRDFSPALSLNYSQIVGAPTTSSINLQVRDFGAEYRINRIFYLTGEILERRPGTSASSAAQSQFEYNLDLRARHEY